MRLLRSKPQPRPSVASCVPSCVALGVWLWCALAFAANTTIYKVPSTTTPGDAATYQTDTSTFLRNEDAARQGELPLFPLGVVAQNGGGLHGTAASMTSPPFATTAYTNLGNRLKQASASINYSTQTCPSGGVAWVIASGQTATTVGTFLRVPGTNYYTDCTSGGTVRPALPADSLYLMKVTFASSQITDVEDISTRALDVESTVLDASRFPGASLGEKVHNALLALPAAGGTVDARRLFRGGVTNLNLAEDMFAGVDVHTPVTVLFGPGGVVQSVQQTVPSLATILCDTQGGVPVNSTVSWPIQGTVFQWAGATNQVMWSVFNATQVTIDGCVFHANQTTGVTPMIIDGTDTPSGVFHKLRGVTFVNFVGNGLAIGGAGGTANATNNSVRLEQIHLVANGAASTGILVNSTNTQNTVFDQVVIHATNVGILLQQNAGWTTIQHLTCGGLFGTLGKCLKVVAVDSLSIRDSAHQDTGGTDATAISWESTGPNQTCHLIDNFFLGRSIRVGANVCLISRGLNGPGQAIVTSGFSPRIVSIGDAFPWANVGTIPTQNAFTGWIASPNTQVTRIAQLSAGPNVNQFPLLLEGDTNATPTLLRVSSNATGGLAGIGLRNGATGGSDWALQASTLNGGDFRATNLNSGLASFIIEPGALANSLYVNNVGVQMRSVTAAALLGVSAPSGTETFCTDCQPTTPATCGNITQAACICVGGGLGSKALRNQGNWFCR